MLFNTPSITYIAYTINPESQCTDVLILLTPQSVLCSNLRRDLARDGYSLGHVRRWLVKSMYTNHLTLTPQNQSDILATSMCVHIRGGSKGLSDWSPYVNCTHCIKSVLGKRSVPKVLHNFVVGVGAISVSGQTVATGDACHCSRWYRSKYLDSGYACTIKAPRIWGSP